MKHMTYIGFSFVIHLLAIMSVMYCFAFSDSIGCKVAFTMHGSYCWDDINVLRYFAMLDKYPVFLLYMCIDFLDHGIHELRDDSLTSGLVYVHDVTHHLCMQCY